MQQPPLRQVPASTELEVAEHAAVPRLLTPPLAVRRWRDALYGIFTASGLLIVSFLSRLPTIRDALGASTETMGFLILGLSSGAVAGLVLAGGLVARFGAVRVVYAGALLACAGVVGGGVVATLAPSFPAVVAGLFVLGLGNSCLNVAMNVSGTAAERALGKTVMPRFHAAFSAGSLGGAGLGALAEQAGVPFGLHVGLVGLLVLGLLLTLTRALRPEIPADAPGSPPTQAAGRPDPLAAWREPRVLLIGLVVLGMAFAEGSANDWIGLAVVDAYGLGDAGGAAMLGVFLAAMLVVRALGGYALDRFGRVLVLRVSAAVAATGLVLFITGEAVPVAAVGIFLWGAGTALGFPVGMSAAADDPQRAAARVSTVSTVGYCAFLVGPVLIGLLGERFGLRGALLAVLVLVVVAGIAAGAVRRRDSPRGPLT